LRHERARAECLVLAIAEPVRWHGLRASDGSCGGPGIRNGRAHALRAGTAQDLDREPLAGLLVDQTAVLATLPASEVEERLGLAKVVGVLRDCRVRLGPERASRAHPAI